MRAIPIMSTSGEADSVGDIVNEIEMAANDIGDRDKANALATLACAIGDTLEDLGERLHVISCKVGKGA